MDYEETMVEEDFDEAAEDDTSFDGFIEEDESEEEEFPDEEELDIDELDDDSEESEEEPEEEAPADHSEPGWMKKRIGKAVDKALAAQKEEFNQILAQQKEEFERQMKPIRDRMIEDEAQELVRSRKVADIETARELVRYRQGQPNMPEVSTRQEQPRNENGQFVSKEQIASEARTQARIDELSRQADKIRANGGPDVIKEFSENPEIKRKVVEGDMDMYDVADYMRSRKTKKPPTPARSPNGASNVTPNAFSNMSSKQFAKFEQKLEEGGSYTFR